MTQPSKFILSTDFATLKNDAQTSTSVTFPASTVVVGSSYAEFHVDLVIGKQASLNRIQIASSKDSNKRYIGKTLGYSRSGSLGAYTILAYTTRISSSTLRCTVYLQNLYGGNMTSEAGNETFSFFIDTFIPPFA